MPAPHDRTCTMLSCCDAYDEGSICQSILLMLLALGAGNAFRTAQQHWSNWAPHSHVMLHHRLQLRRPSSRPSCTCAAPVLRWPMTAQLPRSKTYNKYSFDRHCYFQHCLRLGRSLSDQSVLASASDPRQSSALRLLDVKHDVKLRLPYPGQLPSCCLCHLTGQGLTSTSAFQLFMS